jgi:hypothetical protein
VNNERAFGAFHLAPKSFEPARKPKVILMKKASPIARGFTQAEIGGGYPVSKSAGSNQPNWENSRKLTHNVQSAIAGAIVNDYQLNPFVLLVAHTLERCGDEPFAVVRRHNNRKNGSQFLSFDRDGKSFRSQAAKCPYRHRGKGQEGSRRQRNQAGSSPFRSHRKAGVVTDTLKITPRSFEQPRLKHNQLHASLVAQLRKTFPAEEAQVTR